MKKILFLIGTIICLNTYGQMDTINTGSKANARDGDPLRTAFTKTNVIIKAIRDTGLLNVVSVMKEDSGIYNGGYPTLTYIDSIKQDEFLNALRAQGASIKAFPAGVTGYLNGGYTALTDGRAYYIPFNITKPTLITGVGFVQGDVQGNYTANNYNGFVLYSVSGTTYTKIDSTTNDGNLWKVVPYTASSKAFTTTHTLNPGKYRIALVYNSSAETAAPKITCHSGLGSLTRLIIGPNAILNGYISSQAYLPNTETEGNLTNTATQFGIWIY